jgi:hypothetical protein
MVTVISSVVLLQFSFEVAAVAMLQCAYHTSVVVNTSQLPIKVRSLKVVCALQ